jgi:dehydrogenase/reductase SDR family protein 1
MTILEDQVALVTGASRGVGRGVATALAQAGAVVYATGRTVAAADLPAAVRRVPCDHTDDDTVDALFARLAGEAGRLDILVNNAWGGYERMVEDGRFNWPLPFWEQPRWRWDTTMVAGVRAAVTASQHAARLMLPRGRGLIVNLSYWAARKHLGNVFYGLAKAATDKLTADCAHELGGSGVTVVSLYPGLVRTEAVLAAGVFDLSNSESPEYQGRVIAALAADRDVSRHNGTILVTAEVARAYGVTDIDGATPRPLFLEEA